MIKLQKLNVVKTVETEEEAASLVKNGFSKMDDSIDHLESLKNDSGTLPDSDLSDNNPDTDFVKESKRKKK